ncbi:uncharacterized protein G2W53_014408 [Senna tora]|uniref:Uncharacterized protein n=1 Tax=Senna tora TaxID=362788 RepID=A0A834WTG7_9FABA|nr:uncharacterized protein G2W53_014408 [Senna tora]
MAWEERGSSINIFRMTNRDKISETFMNYDAKDLLRKRSVDYALTYSGRQITDESQKPSRITRQKTCCASESNTSVRVVLANRSGFDAPIGVVLAWKESGSCVNVFRMTKRGRITETFTNYEAKDLLHKLIGHEEVKKKRCLSRNIGQIFRSLGWGGGLGKRGEEEEWKSGGLKDGEEEWKGKPSRITRQKTCCTNESNTSVRVIFANQSGFDAPIGVVLAWEECGSRLNIFQMTNRGQISENFTNYEAKDLLRK